MTTHIQHEWNGKSWPIMAYLVTMQMLLFRFIFFLLFSLSGVCGCNAKSLCYYAMRMTLSVCHDNSSYFFFTLVVYMWCVRLFKSQREWKRIVIVVCLIWMVFSGESRCRFLLTSFWGDKTRSQIRFHNHINKRASIPFQHLVDMQIFGTCVHRPNAAQPANKCTLEPLALESHRLSRHTAWIVGIYV